MKKARLHTENYTEFEFSNVIPAFDTTSLDQGILVKGVVFIHILKYSIELKEVKFWAC